MNIIKQMADKIIYLIPLFMVSAVALLRLFLRAGVWLHPDGACFGHLTAQSATVATRRKVAPKRSTATAKAARASTRPKTRVVKDASAKTGKRKKLKRVRTMAEAIKAKEVVELPNGWKVTPSSVNGYGFPTIDIGRTIPEELYM